MLTHHVSALMCLFGYWIMHEPNPFLCSCFCIKCYVIVWSYQITLCYSGTNWFLISQQCNTFHASLLWIDVINGNTLPQETLRQRLKLLTEEKSDLQSQLMDAHSRIEQEGKVWTLFSVLLSVTRSSGPFILFIRQAALHLFLLLHISVTHFHH